MFLPFLSGAMVAFMVPDPEYSIPAALMSVVLNLMLSPALFGEGAICILMAAPIFVVASLIGAVCGRVVRRKEKFKPPMTLLLIAFALIVFHDVWALRAGASIDTIRTEFQLKGSRAAVWKRLSFDRTPTAQMPLWMRIWVAYPKRFSFGDEGLGSRRFVDFGERTYGDDPDAIRNKFVYETTEWTPLNSCVFTCRENHSRARQWLTLIDTRVEFTSPQNSEITTVTMTTRYQRKLGPSLYFKPFLDAAVSGMQEMLAQEIAEPEVRR